MKISTIKKKLEMHRKRIGAERDKLRDVVSDFESLAETTDRALEDLDRAIDALSEQA